MESEIIKQISQAIQTLHIPEACFLRLDTNHADKIVQQVRDIFISANPRAWWLSLKMPTNIFDFPAGDAVEHLTNYMPDSPSRCWFLPDDESAQQAVYDVNVSYLVPVLRECLFFEYYLVNKTYSWLLAENDHNQLIFASANVDRMTETNENFGGNAP